ncbi:DUF427 domain-containing protein [Microbacterium sp. JB110]|uniref:DUF427 domain-containing protein n=1 Tax=Microbacterium sp. JB110 TaxID=2024477 RepID=UPI00097EF05E|nr:DUF427 domain-containing protein [Microbacterium sp. JB110]RCS59161.1 DUF427 domain-containing protein [Microbacterium sp. JB110]SJM68432.1 hypothetical protein CZ774_16240 [Frigoribacterium sp. JB110]
MVLPAAQREPRAAGAVREGYTCSWRGDASYFSIEAEGERETDAAWCYPHMDDAAIARIGVDAREYVAFSPAVSVIAS